MFPGPASGFQGAATGPLVGFSADVLTASNRRTVGQGCEGAGTPFCRWDAGEIEVFLGSVQPALRLDGVMRLNAEDAPRARGMQRESAASPLPSLRVLPRTTCDLHNYALFGIHVRLGRLILDAIYDVDCASGMLSFSK